MPLNICSGRFKFKVTLEVQMRKWSQLELVQTITCTFKHGFQNNLAELLAHL